MGVAGCGAKPDNPASPGTLFELRLGEITIQTELAITLEEQRKGLMNRASLPENQGMLFIYREPGRMEFWMKNTKIPLRIGFFNEKGILREIHPLYPHDLTMLQSKSDKILFALEVNKGWFEANNIKLGDSLDIKDVNKGLQARGYPPVIVPVQ